MDDHDDFCTLGEQLFATAKALAKVSTRVNETLGNDEAAMAKLIDLKQELHELALAYAYAFRHDRRRAGMSLVKIK